MKALADVFRFVLDMSVTATGVLAFVLILREFLKQAAKITPYALWSIVLFRLVCPVSFTSSFSLLGIFNRLFASSASLSALLKRWTGPSSPSQPLQVLEHGGPLAQAVNQLSMPLETLPANMSASSGYSATASGSALTLDLNQLLPLLWLAGFVIMLAYMAIVYWQMKRRLADATRIQKQVYETDKIVSPFVFGLIRPHIYLPVGLSPEDAGYVLQHEFTHIHRMDHLVKPLAFMVLACHWFNPFMWLAHSLMGRDMEMSCDEKATKDHSHLERSAYVGALLKLSLHRRPFAISPLAFGESDAKRRIRHILSNRKPIFQIAVAAVIIAVIAGFALIADPLAKPLANSSQTTQTIETNSAFTTVTQAKTEPTTANSQTNSSQTTQTTVMQAAQAPYTAPVKLEAVTIESWTQGKLAKKLDIVDSYRLRIITDTVMSYFLSSSGNTSLSREKMGDHIQFRMDGPDGKQANDPFYVFFRNGEYHMQYGLSGYDKEIHSAFYEPFVSLLLGGFGFYHEPEHRLQPRQDGVDEFLKLAQETGYAKLPRMYADDVCHNITPEEIGRETGCRIFKYEKSSAAYLQVGRQIHVLGESFGGSGLTDIQTCDFDRDGQLELLYTFSWGSGIHRSQIGHFNLKSGQQTILKYTHMNRDMYLGKVSKDQFTVYDAVVTIKGGNFADLVTTRKDRLAQIIAKDGMPTIS